jgi:hypothetical protein
MVWYLVLIYGNIPVFTNERSKVGMDQIGDVVVGIKSHQFQIFKIWKVK